MNAILNIVPLVTASLDYSVFKKAMTNACKVVERKNTIPVLDQVLIAATRGGAHVIGTDMDIYTTTFVPGKIDHDFLALVDAHKLKATMDKVKDAADINLVLDDGKLVASIGKLNLTLKQDLLPSEFPLADKDDSFRSALKTSNASFVVPADILRTILTKVQFAISTEETRYYLNGVFMHTDERQGLLKFVTTDGHRLARYEIPLPAGAGAMSEPVIIPRKTVVELLRLLKRKDCPFNVLITTAAKGISFKVGEDELLESKVIDGTFPDYVRVIPTGNPHHVPVRSAEFIESLKQAASVLTGKNAGAKLVFTAGRLLISCTDPDFGTASTEIHVDHEAELEVGINTVSLLEILNHLDGGAMMQLADPGSPIIIKDGADDCVTYVQMPMRV